ncbi:RNA exonuclease 5 [Bombina bombina]|uniref:RNA exonuclease 5 n=1 Tax=Bombina bombina TaxID=8345 RepID=UPI00235ABEF4|nr:RNA exonuclease 5 [Bombina bombina]
MSKGKSILYGKQPSSGETNEIKSKKKRQDSDIRQEIISSDLQKLKKAPRLSPALFQDNCEIHHSQIHELLKYAALGKRHNVAQASWCHILHQKRLSGVFVVVLQDLSQLHFYRYYLYLRRLRRRFRHRFVLSPSPCDLMASLFGISDTKELNPHNLPKNIKDSPDVAMAEQSPAKYKRTLDPVIDKYGTEKCGLTRYLLTEEEIRTNDYPLAGSLDSANCVPTGFSGEVTDSSPLFGLDCEMCLTDKGSELTRISLVDASGRCIMDELVKPDNPIQNYMTRFSGITKKLLNPVKTKLKEVQDKIKTLLPPDAVLVGHSLNNDLWALQMIHMNVIDTALLYAREFERKFRLKFLTEAVLGREIQCENVIGHDPAEDAKAALDLARYFIDQGPKKVAQLNLQRVLRKNNKPNKCNGSVTAAEEIPVLQQNGHVHPLETILKEHEMDTQLSLAESLLSAGRKVTYVARKYAGKDNVPENVFDTILCSSEDEVLERACSILNPSALSVVHFRPENIYNKCTELTGKIRMKFAEMMTVFAGPFKKDICMYSVRRAFRSCGPIHSMVILEETHQPYIRIQYGVLEAAHLAVEVLNGSCIDGCYIKVEKLVTERTFDSDNLIKEMEEDLENEDIIYVSGFKKPLTEEILQEQFSHLKDIKAIFVPTNPSKGKRAKYCYLKFHNPQSALTATDYIRAHTVLLSRKALTANHLHRWLQTADTSLAHQPDQEIHPKEEEQIAVIKHLDRKIKQLYESLQGNTLCLILFPGKNSDTAELPGLGLMGIKSE